MDHARVNATPSNISCGVVELSRMAEDLDDVLFAIGNRFYHPSRGNPPAFAIFSNVTDIETVAHRIAKKIREMGLGDVFCTEPKINPNTGNPIAVWTWGIKHEVFKKWYYETRINKLKAKAN